MNDIYGLLKKQLSPNEMSLLREKQIKWIKYRDDKAKTDSLKFEGWTMESLEYSMSLEETTKKRCYELVEVYIKVNFIFKDINYKGWLTYSRIRVVVHP